MTPSKCPKHGSWRGPCPFKSVGVKYIWNLLGKGIGHRNLKLHLTIWTSALVVVTVIDHFACKMLSQLIVCKFSNSGLVTDGRLNNFLRMYLLFMFITIGYSSPTGLLSGPDSVTYEQDGRYIKCSAVTCRKGFEVVPCTETGGTDACRLCPADRYLAQDNVTSHLKLKCYEIICAPDNQRPVQYGPISPGNPPVCECDTERNFYQDGDQRENCRKRECGKNEKLTRYGSCVCKEGRLRDDSGQCVWKHPGGTAPVPADLTTATAPGQLDKWTEKLTTETGQNTVSKTTISTSEGPPVESDLIRTTLGTSAFSPRTNTSDNINNESNTTEKTDVLAIFLIVTLLFLAFLAAVYIIWKCRRKKGDYNKCDSDEGTSTSNSGNDEERNSTPSSPGANNVTITNNYNVSGENVHMQVGVRCIMHKSSAGNQSSDQDTQVEGDQMQAAPDANPTGED